LGRLQRRLHPEIDPDVIKLAAEDVMEGKRLRW